MHILTFDRSRSFGSYMTAQVFIIECLVFQTSIMIFFLVVHDYSSEFSEIEIGCAGGSGALPNSAGSTGSVPEAGAAFSRSSGGRLPWSGAAGRGDRSPVL